MDNVILIIALIALIALGFIPVVALGVLTERKRRGVMKTDEAEAAVGAGEEAVKIRQFERTGILYFNDEAPEEEPEEEKREDFE